jgi:glycosyltransferase involved in cell wall biosynthesis
MVDSLSKNGQDDHQPLISVIMNCYNSARYLREAIESVLAQTYSHWEIVFWDNQSTDESASIFKSYSDPRLRYCFAPEHTKLGEARNLAVMQAKGEWIGFLDCDDLWLPDKLEKQVAIILNENESLGMVYGQMLVLGEDFDVSSKWLGRMSNYSKKTLLKTLPEGRVFEKLLTLNFIPMLTAIVKRELYFEVGGLSEHFEMSEDYELFVKISAIREVRAVQDIIALYRIHQSNTSTLNLEKGFRECLEIVSRYLPNPSAISGLQHHHLHYAIDQIRDGKSWSGICHIAAHGGLLSMLSIVRRKIIGKL